MSRAFDPHNLDSPAAPPPAVRRSVPSHPVCPFCGTINETAGAACRQCGMENSQATRAATRAKLGPWYVWQTKNPAAPGMNFATLLSLVERGRVTPRSIVRGPTTHQLWRYAARVKGLSREFGACWGCGAEVTKLSRVCPSCKRLQQPPINPDVLLETADAAQTAPSRPPADAFAAGSPFPREAEPEPSRRPEPPPVAEPTARRRPAPVVDQPSVARPMPGGRPMGGMSFVPVSPSSLPVVDMGDTPLGEGMELAAFNLPRGYGSAGKPVGRRIFKGILIAFLLAGISFGAMLYFNPNLAPQYSAWMHAAVARISSLFGSGTPPQKPARSQSDASDAPVRTILNHPTVNPSAAPGSTDRRPSRDLPGVSSDVPASRAALSTTPADAPPAEPKRPAPVVSIEVTAATTDPEGAEKQAWVLREAAMSAEKRDDYATAVKHYEAILKLPLPDNVGPTDVQIRLTTARLLLNSTGK